MTMNREATLVLIRDGRITVFDQHGLRPLVDGLREDPGQFAGAWAIDKVVGKASALLLAYGGVKKITGLVMSRAADQLLTARGIEHEAYRLVDHILNADGTDMCPMEKKAAPIDDPAQACQMFREFFAQKR
jgi:hypothetical protein